jgi:dihydroorotate dehydrogenase electron transfer subunit
VVFTPANARKFVTSVIENVQLSQRYFMLRLVRPTDMPEPEAGHFVHMAVPDTGRFFLRRPFSIFDCTADRIDLLIVEVGMGTQAVRTLGAGDEVDFLGPIGHGFPGSDRLGEKSILAIGGGVGLAPLYYYGYRAPAPTGENYRLLYGARMADDLFLDHISLDGEGVSLSTDDGSHGFAGNVVQLAEAELERAPADVIFSCGPTVMMKAVDALARRKGIEHYASLENRMACALGACRACVVPTSQEGPSPYRTVCHDGPVFDAACLLCDKLPTP